MTALSGDELAAACARSMYARDVAAQGLGISVVQNAEGCATLRMTVRDDMLNGHGICHGGFIFTLADTAFAYACNSRNQVAVAQTCDIDFVQPGRAGDVLTANARELHFAGRSGVYDVTVTRADGVILAHFRGRSRLVQGNIIND